MSFGLIVKNLRIAQKKTLRQFCEEHGLDPSNWSKIERGVNPPPKDEGILEKWARLLGLEPATEAWQDFMCQADVSRGSIPREIMNDAKLLSKMPVFFRTVRGAELTEKQLDNFISKLKDAYTPDRHED
jgi:transcriptional regulator with XRE-family HTH domain